MKSIKKWKLITATALVCIMSMSVAACQSSVKEQTKTNVDSSPVATSTVSPEASSGEVANELEWLHPGELPLVSEGTEKTLKAAIVLPDSGDGLEAEERYFYKFIENEMNIDLEVDAIAKANRVERLTLMFADGNDLPDMFIACSLKTSDLMNYGAREGQLIDLAPYITPEIMPNLYAFYEANPDYKAAVTDADGHIWSLGYIGIPEHKTLIERMFLNHDWLEAVGKEVPTTLDEFIDVLRAFKTLGDDVIPMGGSVKSYNPMQIIMTAYGYLSNNSQGVSIAMRDGEVVLPIADREVFGEVIKTMNTLYTEGLIHPDFYTMDSATVKSLIAEGKNGFIADSPTLFMTEDKVNSWWYASPLATEESPELIWPARQRAMGIGQFAITSACEDVELACAFADLFYAEDCMMVARAFRGAGAQETEYLYDDSFAGFVYNADTKTIEYNYDKNNKEMVEARVGEWSWCTRNVMLWNTDTFGYLDPDTFAYQIMCGVPEAECEVQYPSMLENEKYYTTLRKELSGDAFWEAAMEYPAQYVQPWLGNAFLDSEVNAEITNLYTVFKEYADQEIAKFVTGLRPLDELDDYFDEMERLGANEYVKAYKEYYGK